MEEIWHEWISPISKGSNLDTYTLKGGTGPQRPHWNVPVEKLRVYPKSSGPVKNNKKNVINVLHCFKSKLISV